MRPVLLEIGPLPVFGYGTAVAAGGLAALRLLWSRRGRLGLGDRDAWLFAYGLILAGFGGGHLLYLLQYAPSGAEAFRRAAWSVMSGYSVLGGFAGGAAFVAVYARLRGGSFLRLMDTVSWCGAVWHVFGRLGCFLAGCCYGKPTDLPWGVAFRDPRGGVPASLLGVPLHPTQLYEMSGDVLIAAAVRRALLAADQGRVREGSAAATYLAAYGAMRFFTEFARGDTRPLSGFWTMEQALALGLVAASGAILLGRRRCARSC